MDAYTNPPAEGKADELIKIIKMLVAKGDRARDKAEQFYIAAGLHLKTLKAEHTGTWAEWESLLKDKCGIGKSRASELMQIADGTKTVEQVRAGTAQRMVQHRQSSPSRDGKSQALAVVDDVQNPKGDVVTIDPLTALLHARDAAPAEAKLGFVETNVAELRDLLAEQRKRAARAAADRAVERSMPAPAVSPSDRWADYPELPACLNRTKH